MAKVDYLWRQIMAECQEHHTCRKPMLCRSEGVCYFVAALERHDEREQWKRQSPPVIHWQPGYDEPEKVKTMQLFEVA